MSEIKMFAEEIQRGREKPLKSSNVIKILLVEHIYTVKEDESEFSFLMKLIIIFKCRQKSTQMHSPYLKI